VRDQSVSIQDLDPDDPVVAQQVRSGRRRQLFVPSAVLIVIASTAGLVLGVHGDKFVTPVVQPAGWVLTVGVVLILAGAGVGIASLVFVVRTGRYRRTSRSPLWTMTVAQRRRLMKQIMRNRVTPGTDLSTLRYFAGLLTDQRSLMYGMAGVAMINTGNALISRSSLQFVAGVVAAAGFVLGLGQAIRESGRAAVFLRDHPLPNAALIIANVRSVFTADIDRKSVV
jgi:hypothetical protein